MPILDVEFVASDTDLNTQRDLTQSLADVAANVFGTPQGTVWVKLRFLPAAYYAEDHGKPDGVYPVFVKVLKAYVPEETALESEISRLTKSVAAVLGRPEANVHIFYQPNAAGRTAFGGNLVR